MIRPANLKPQNRHVGFSFTNRSVLFFFYLFDRAGCQHNGISSAAPSAKCILKIKDHISVVLLQKKRGEKRRR